MTADDPQSSDYRPPRSAPSPAQVQVARADNSDAVNTDIRFIADRHDGWWTMTRWYIEFDAPLGTSEMPPGFLEDELRLMREGRATVR